MAEVRASAEGVLREHDHIDALVNNAGVSIPSGPRRESLDGFELHLAVNHPAPFLLTHLPLPVLGTARPSLVVNVASAGQSSVDFEDLTANCLHPGTHLDTTMVRAAGIAPAGTAEEGANAVHRLLSAERLAHSTGRYFDGVRETRMHPQAYDFDDRARLRGISEQLTALDQGD
ncbi:hypothetical protein GCM10027445_16150 [Amycolatopsis endophytica]|uniref:NAD(P)-dependent dehydrogenase (Short-subunit alcohol dehydrogenase family) n=1 Tax=Amycolatopsis endophytica TaxID=860233 RepID=A0A853B608_9PSEU|nr:NAD(P)-dependent dehydrogenase (short-subunit alcohol dehydrogenase family) [Amycolatopsis endophytica]